MSSKKKKLLELNSTKTSIEITANKQLLYWLIAALLSLPITSGPSAAICALQDSGMQPKSSSL